jgi:hypothetical protein
VLAGRADVAPSVRNYYDARRDTRARWSSAAPLVR